MDSAHGLTTGHDGRLDALMRELRRQASGRAELDPVKVLTWLRRQTTADVALVSGTDTVELSTPDFPREILRPLKPTLTRLSGGQVAAVATQAGGRQVLLEAFGPHEQRPVLVAASPEGLTEEAASLISYTGSVIAILRRARDADKVSRSDQQKAKILRFAVFTALMAGDPSLARRMTTGAVPPLLASDRIRVNLLYCASDDRDRLAQIYQDASGYHGQSLLVPCPVYNGHLICVTPDGADPTDPRSRSGVPLRLVRENPHYALGVSGAFPLDATAEAYRQACHALALARNAPSRMATYDGNAPLGLLLPRKAALAWARSFLRPLERIPNPTIHIIHLAMTLPRSGVARLLDISRNTVTAHVKQAERMLALDLDDVHCRAALSLALAITGGKPDIETDHEPSAPTLDTLLQTPTATAWAQALLTPLHDTRHRNVRTTVRAWIDANTDAQQTAGQLGISRNTVRAHLRTAERLLNRDLLATGSGVHDLVHALRAVAAQ